MSFAATVLRGGKAIWPATWTGDYENDFLNQANRNGIEALIHDRSHTAPSWNSWPGSVRGTLKTNSQLDAAVEILRKSELIRVLNTLNEAKLNPLLFKGTPLAYSLYPAPHLRPRVDTDLLLPRRHIDQTEDLLKALGYEPELTIPGDAILSQQIWKRMDEKGLSHTFDLHWRISNPQAFADILTYEELMADSESVHSIGASARAPSAVLALLIACIHRAAHHLASNRLIWLYDMHLLGQTMTKDDFARFVELALEKGVRAVCLNALESAQSCFATTLPAELLADLRSNLAVGKDEVTRAYVRPPRNRLHLLWRDLRSKAGFGAMLRSLRQHALPAPSYMLRRYDTHHKALLPYLYIRRFAEGVPKLFRRFG